MEERLNEIKAVLKKYGQEQLLNNYERLDDTKKKELLDQIENIDFELIKSLYDKTEQEEKHSQDVITPIEYLDKYKLQDKYKKENWQLLLWQEVKVQD